MGFCFLDPGDVALVPDPGYPVYAIGTWFAGGECRWMPLLEENGWLPDLDAIPAEVARRAKVMWLNYPNNPTGAVAEFDYFERVVEFAKRTTSPSPTTPATRRSPMTGTDPELPPGAGRHGRGDRVPLPVQELQHDRMAP